MNGEPIPAGLIPQMEAAFGKAHLEGYVIEGSQIRVPRGQQAAYMGALAEAKALPPNFGSYFRRRRGVRAGILDHPETRKRRTSRLQEELSLIIRSMSGIESASVMIDAEAKPAFGQQQLKTASVAVKAVGSESLSEDQVRVDPLPGQFRRRRLEARKRHRARPEQRRASITATCRTAADGREPLPGREDPLGAGTEGQDPRLPPLHSQPDRRGQRPIGPREVPTHHGDQAHQGRGRVANRKEHAACARGRRPRRRAARLSAANAANTPQSLGVAARRARTTKNQRTSPHRPTCRASSRSKKRASA